MGIFSKFLLSQNWVYLLPMVLGMVPCVLISMVFSQGCSKKAYQLGDATPSLNGHGGFHPLIHLDLVGFILFVTAGIGWAKALPLKPNNFKKPMGDSLRVLLAGVGRCVVLALLMLGVSNVLWPMAEEHIWVARVVWFCLYTAVLSCGFILAQWLPLPCFPVYQLIFPSFEAKKSGFAEKIQVPIMGILLVLLWAGYLPPVFATVVGAMLKPFCVLVPFSVVEYYFL